MITIPTVLVLGAGASKPYQFPSAQSLKHEICRTFSNPRNPQYIMLLDARFSPDKINTFVQRLSGSALLSVDAFLEHNPDFVDIGKAAIVTILLPREVKQNLTDNFVNVNLKGKSWYQLLAGDLDSPFDEFSSNKLSIITFNYDRSLEKYLFTHLKSTYGKTSEECAEKISSIPIIHIYGSLGRLEWQSSKIAQVRYGAKLDKDIILTASENIEIIPANVYETLKIIEARNKIRAAKKLYFLGFGYHEMNLKRLAPVPDILKAAEIAGTSLDLKWSKQNYVWRWSNTRLGDYYNNLLDMPIYKFLHEHVDFNVMDFKRGTSI